LILLNNSNRLTPHIDALRRAPECDCWWRVRGAAKKRVSSSGTLRPERRGDNQKANIELVHPEAQ